MYRSNNVHDTFKWVMLVYHACLYFLCMHVGFVHQQHVCAHLWLCAWLPWAVRSKITDLDMCGFVLYEKTREGKSLVWYVVLYVHLYTLCGWLYVHVNLYTLCARLYIHLHTLCTRLCVRMYALCVGLMYTCTHCVLGCTYTYIHCVQGCTYTCIHCMLDHGFRLYSRMPKVLNHRSGHIRSAFEILTFMSLFQYWSLGCWKC